MEILGSISGSDPKWVVVVVVGLVVVLAGSLVSLVERRRQTKPDGSITSPKECRTRSPEPAAAADSYQPVEPIRPGRRCLGSQLLPQQPTKLSRCTFKVAPLGVGMSDISRLLATMLTSRYRQPW
jgi:hypothetical protein